MQLQTLEDTSRSCIVLSLLQSRDIAYWKRHNDFALHCLQASTFFSAEPFWVLIDNPHEGFIAVIS